MTSLMDRSRTDADGARSSAGARIAGPARPGARRPGLPSGRALVGSLLVVIAAAGVLVAHRAATSPPTTRFVVATRDVAAGTTIGVDDLGSVAIDLPSNVAAIDLADAEGVVGSVARHDLAKMDLIRPGDLRDPATAPEASSIIVPVEVAASRALADAVHPGSRVHVLATDPDGAGTSVLATDVLVAAVDDHEADGIGVSGTASYRLALPDPQIAAAVVDASVRQELTLVAPEAGSDRG